MRTLRYVHAAFGMILLVASQTPSAAARVGVTSTSEGDPLGKPPAEQERVLRVGIDIQADELVTTHADDRVHLVFLDGTSLTVSANAVVRIDRFVYDPAKGTGGIDITATKGVFRLVGGKISKSNAITVQTPSATLGLRGGIGLFTVNADQTTAHFLFGKSLQVTAAGRTETALRPGSEIKAASGGPPSLPAAIARGGLAQALGTLEASRANGNTTADDQAKRSGFSDQNSGQAGRTLLPSNVAALNQAALDALARIGNAANGATHAGTADATASGSVPPPVVPPPVPPPPPPPVVEGHHHHHHHHHFFHHHHHHHPHSSFVRR
jgi:hypothetical protein